MRNIVTYRHAVLNHYWFALLVIQKFPSLLIIVVVFSKNNKEGLAVLVRPFT